MVERRRLLPALLILLAFSQGCGRKPNVKLPPPRPVVVGETETGLASWYGHPYHGRRASNGEVYDMNKMTAAHLSWPFGTWVRVTNLDNGREVDVRINDRGPFVKDRVIDLSRAAAQQIAMLGPGTARVRLKVIARPVTQQARSEPPAPQAREERQPPATETAPTDPPIRLEPDLTESGRGDAPCQAGPYYGVQVGSFRVIENARRLQAKLNGRYGLTQILRKPMDQGLLYRVVVGPTADHVEANRLLDRLERDRIAGYVTLVAETDSLNCL